MPRISEEKADIKSEEKKPEQETQVQLITENQLINLKLDKILELLEAKK